MTRNQIIAKIRAEAATFAKYGQTGQILAIYLNSLAIDIAQMED